MGLFGFGKKKDEGAATATNGDAAGGGDDKGAAGGFHADPAKARSWFNRAHQVADTNHDYAIDCFVSGLRFDPESMKEHEALYEVAIRRLAGGGKPAGLGETMKSGGKTIVEKFTHAEKLWAMDPRNGARALAVMEKAAQLHETEPSLEYMGEVVVWLGGKVMELNTGKKASKSTFVKAMELFESVKAYKQAEEACRRAIQMDSDDGQLISKMKDLAALKTIDDANLKKGSTFRDGVKDLDKQKALDEEDQMHHDDAGHDRMIARAKAAWQAKPDDLDLRLKVVKALLAKADDDTDEEAIKLLREAYEKTGQYRFKYDIGDVTMRQFQRHYRMLKDNLASDPSMAKEMEELRRKQLAFELEEFTERVAQYPTMMKLRYELGKRMIQSKRYEEAVAHFQDAKGDAKIKVQSMEALAICYLHMEWLEPAVDTLKEAIRAHPLPDDELAKSLKYLQIDALERYARKFNSLEHAREAQSVASTLLQIDIRYRDIREKVNKLRDLVAEMSKKA